MNNQNPLIPQGSLLEQKNKTRIRVKIAVIFVLALHGIGLLALLMQGCGHENGGAPGSTSANSNSPSAGMAEPAPANPAPSFAAPTNPAPETTSTTSSATSPPPAAVPTNPVQAAPPEMANPAPSTPQPGVSDYKIANGDTLFKLHKKFHVSLQALIAANPGVDSAKLKIGQTIHVPAQAAAAAAPAGPGAAPGAMTEGAGGQQVYTVKSSDNLAKIARQFGVRVKALRAANNLRTDKIKVGQKLKIPARTAAGAEGTPAAAGSSNSPATPSGR
jgi:LysM repeat protein